MSDEPLPIAFKQLEQYYDYTKWHVGLYAGGIAGAWLLKDGAAEGAWWACQGAGTVLFVSAAACAGAICGTIPECKTLADLDKKHITILQITAGDESRWPTGKTIRRFEKIFFWLGVLCMVTFLLWAPESTKKTLTACCTCGEPVAASPDNARKSGGERSISADSESVSKPGMDSSRASAGSAKSDAGTR